jgi:hypothetical protein
VVRKKEDVGGYLILRKGLSARVHALDFTRNKLKRIIKRGATVRQKEKVFNFLFK